MDFINGVPAAADELVIYQDMGAQRINAGGDGPDVEMIGFPNAVDLCYFSGDGLNVNMGRNGFQKNVHRFRDKFPRAVDDYE